MVVEQALRDVQQLAAVDAEAGQGGVQGAEEVLVVLEGEVEITVGDERGRARAGAIAVVPAEVPHDVAAVEGPAKVAGVFSANTIVSVFEDTWVPYGTRVLGTPPPAETLAAA